MTTPPLLSYDLVAAFCRRHHIRRLSLFGSVARSDGRPDSDVDVLVEFEPGFTPGLAFFRIESELAALIGRPVDLNTPAWLGPRIHALIQSDLQVLYDAA